MHVLWVNEWAQCVGGCERYVSETAAMLQQEGVVNSLLYSVKSRVERVFCQPFTHSFPLVDIAAQVAELAPDLIYIHRLTDEAVVDEFIASGVVCVRFFHDHKLFCLREHKYTTITRQSCNRPIGQHCYSCLGFINKSNQWPGVKLNSLARANQLLQLNRRLQGIVVGSTYMRRHVIAHHFDAAMIEVIPLYCRDPYPGGGFAQVAATRSLAEAGNFLFVGQLQVGKGVDLLLKAMSKMCQPMELDICGDGDAKRSLQAMAMKLGVADRVHFLGRLSGELLDDAYARACCLILPARTPETFGLVGIEAMSHGLAVVATAVGGIPDWLVNGENGFQVEAGDVRALAVALDSAVANRAQLERFGGCARQRYLERFKPQYHLEHLLAYFTRLIDGQ
ncbi:glycosyltransferase involved in cell wall biosynthesis [Sinobacterium caligoides]|uniref:Glycosyltransferase involved in cell wall biosynthesis n=1 Tax=Sinobacterium caligoides TaxID=933926 RepID=A0A3N2DQD8_9GAMM|nr:glycosyltransferase family 4 protein [Sinobacterium caligoides]ROS01515.1 glycosyltransferase involved in cell wall biosynthesis [Sinobacterium caligoides]